MKLQRSYDLVVLTAPTGSGKSAVAMDLAKSLSAEILVVDAMQVYRGMNVGTGKPSAPDVEEVAHHGIDLVEPQMEFTAAMYRDYAVTVVKNVLQRSRMLILVCGTGLYLRTLLDGLCAAPAANLELRQMLSTQALEEGLPALYRQLRQVDPDSASKVHPNDQRRIIRALEVYELSGKPLSHWQQETKSPLASCRICRIGLLRERQDLYSRINERVDLMWEAGWVEEARHLHDHGVSKTAGQALGYRQIFSALEAKLPLEELQPLIQQETRRYSKRQMTWFRKDSRIHWMNVSPFESSEQTAWGIRSFLGC
ncbi:MAG: tRNA (adenosine(37)-N6)-dimethylallyltransferase MiaA [Candidatus Omnitrophica bacterium]|nr:tRNA (adenosine(37)-N6)-dimethylallyltransferase MiaA [Candidatus Omnitrophota bacterium]